MLSGALHAIPELITAKLETNMQQTWANVTTYMVVKRKRQKGR